MLALFPDFCVWAENTTLFAYMNLCEPDVEHSYVVPANPINNNLFVTTDLKKYKRGYGSLNPKQPVSRAKD